MIWILIPVLTAVVFGLWFSPLGERIGIGRWPKSDD